MNASLRPRDLYARVLQGLNGIKRPSIAEEITDWLNARLAEGEKPFRERDVSHQLCNIGDSALTVYWLKSRPRRSTPSHRSGPDLDALARLLPGWHPSPSGVPVWPFDSERFGRLYSRSHVWRCHAVYRYLGCQAGNASVPEFLGRGGGNRGRAGLRWHLLQDLMRAREYARASRGGLRLDPRDACFGGRLSPSNNVGDVKHFCEHTTACTREERHFALVGWFALSNLGSLVIVRVRNSVRPNHLFDRNLDHDYCFELPGKGERDAQSLRR